MDPTNLNGLMQISADFAYQSYLSSIDLEKGVLDPGIASLITSSTRQVDVQATAFGLALRPESETPVAVEFRGRGSQKSSALLKPGQVIYPNGKDPGDEFSGFSWGLPYGWLGGGLATLVVLTSPRAKIDWPTPNRDLVIQRQRMRIWAKTQAISALTIPSNWPTRFPSLGVQRPGVAGVNLAAGGRPSLKVHPTKVLVRLRSAAALTQLSTVRLAMFNTHLLDLQSNGAASPVAQGVTFRDLDFGAYAMAGADAFAVCPQFQTVSFSDGPLVELGCELGSLAGVVAVDTGNGDDLSGAYLDILRLGRL